jgi:hypothetical protein
LFKRTDSAYSPGRRGKAWLKLKRELATLDCVVVGVEWGLGRHEIVVEPEIVVEIAFDIIQRSDLHASGFSLRFPRIVRLRPDKPASEADTCWWSMRSPTPTAAARLCSAQRRSHNSSEMFDRGDYRSEQERFLADPRLTLGPRAWDALGRVRDELALDYAGIDFALAGDGRIVIFEANAAMTPLRPDDDERFAYRPPRPTPSGTRWSGCSAGTAHER